MVPDTVRQQVMLPDKENLITWPRGPPGYPLTDNVYFLLAYIVPLQRDTGQNGAFQPFDQITVIGVAGFNSKLIGEKIALDIHQAVIGVFG